MSANGGNGAIHSSVYTAPYLARSLLINLWRLRWDHTKTMMTHREVFGSNIGASLTAFKEQMRIKLRYAKEYLAEHLDEWESNGAICFLSLSLYRTIILFSEQAIEDIDLISELLIEFVRNNGWDPESYHTIEGLGLPEGEPIHDDGGIDDEDEEDYY